MNESKIINDHAPTTTLTLFERLSVVASDMSGVCVELEGVVAKQGQTSGIGESLAFQELDRMSQNLREIASLMKCLSKFEHGFSQSDLYVALETVSLPSLKSFLESGKQQIEQGSVDLF